MSFDWCPYVIQSDISRCAHSNQLCSGLMFHNCYSWARRVLPPEIYAVYKEHGYQIAMQVKAEMDMLDDPYKELTDVDSNDVPGV